MSDRTTEDFQIQMKRLKKHMFRLKCYSLAKYWVLKVKIKKLLPIYFFNAQYKLTEFVVIKSSTRQAK